MRRFVRKNLDTVSLERREPILDAIFDKAMNGIVIDDLMEAAS